MSLTAKAKELHAQVSQEGTKLGDLRKIAKEIKRNHKLAMELWSKGGFMPRQLAILIMDKKLLTQEVIDQLDQDLQTHDYKERNHLTDWLMANQLMKDKKTLALIQSWENSPSPLQRRVFWYYQARLRWTGQTPPDNTGYLMEAIESNIVTEVPEVQWAMNFTAGQIGTYEEAYRSRCIALGENTGLYQEEMGNVPKGCTPNYLPEFIRMQVSKLKK